MLRIDDGHTLKTVIPAIEATTGAEIMRAIADAGYRGHGAPAPYDIRIYTSGQKRRMTPAIKRLMRRRSAVEPVIGHLKSDHRMNAATSPVLRATLPTPCSLPPATTTAASSPGSRFGLPSSSSRSARAKNISQPDNPVVHRRLVAVNSPDAAKKI